MVPPKSRLRSVTLLLSAILVLSIAPSPARADDPVHVLWIGNSYTYVNDLPKMVGELAKAGKQRPLVQERETPGGCTLEKHWKDGKALEKLRARKWDFVVLQEHSLRPLKEREAMFDAATKFDAEIRKQGGKTLLYLTWARANAPENQEKLTKAYLDLAVKLKAQVVPVGVAWAKALAADKARLLHQADKSHPTPTGTYLAACVFYATLFGKTPEGLPDKPGGLTDEDARKLQTIAWQVVQDTNKKKEAKSP
jgi:hypothetical protein